MPVSVAVCVDVVVPEHEPLPPLLLDQLTEATPALSDAVPPSDIELRLAWSTQIEVQSPGFFLGVTFNLRKLLLNSLFVLDFIDSQDLVTSAGYSLPKQKSRKFAPAQGNFSLFTKNLVVVGCQ